MVPYEEGRPFFQEEINLFGGKSLHVLPSLAIFAQ
jgi:hypothetical protein